MIYHHSVQKSSFRSSNPPLALSAAAYEYHAPPTCLLCNLHLNLVFAANSLPLFLHLDSDSFCLLCISVFLTWSDVFSLQPQSCYPSAFIPFHLLCSRAISLHVSSFSLLSSYSCQRYSINCFCIPSAAAELFYSPMLIHSCIQL